MNVSRLNWVSIGVVLLMFAVAAWYYPSLPDSVPTHWNAAGEADGWTPKPWGAYLIPVIALGSILVLLVLPVISPRGFRLDAARRAYDIVIFALAAFLAVIEVYSFRSAIHGAENLSRAVPMLIGFLLIVLGNYLGKFPKNFFVGIRTPWALASDVVWNRTHRLGGYLFMLGGLLILLSGLFDSPPWVMITVVIVVALVPAAYSLVLYRKLHGFTDNGQ